MHLAERIAQVTHAICARILARDARLNAEQYGAHRFDAIELDHELSRRCNEALRTTQRIADNDRRRA